VFSTSDTVEFMKTQLRWALGRQPNAVTTFEELSERDPKAGKAVRMMRRIRNDAIAAGHCFMDAGYDNHPTRNTAIEFMHTTWNYVQPGDVGEIAMIHYTLVFIECGRRGLLDCPCTNCLAEQARNDALARNHRKTKTELQTRVKRTRSRL
jgi:hypothetical protein